MNFFLQKSELRDLYDKVVAGQRLSDEDALRLFESKDLNAVGAMADFARARQVGNHASYIINRYVNYSNYCILSCQFCAFARKKRDADGFQFTVEEIVQKARETLALGVTELHIVGGLHPSLPFSYYTDMLKALRTLNAPLPGSTGVPPAGSEAASPGTSLPLPVRNERGENSPKTFTRLEPMNHPLTRPSGTLSPSGGEGWGEGAVHGEGWGEGHPIADTTAQRQAERASSPQPSPPSVGGEGVKPGLLNTHAVAAPRLHLKCFTAIEILHLAWLAKKTVPETLAELKAAGLDSLTGGGAEIFRKEIRSAIAKGKESAEEYLDVHRTWHQLGGRSTCTMLFGHVESLADRVDHLRQLRALQDETHGFTGFIPLPYQPDNNKIQVTTRPTGFDSLRTVAVSRLYLDNFDHITAYWVGMGLKLAQVALSYGADDIHGTIIEEHIFHMAGAKSPQLQTEHDMVKAIREAGRRPVQRNTFYEPIKVWEPSPASTPAEPPANKSKLLEDNLATA